MGTRGGNCPGTIEQNKKEQPDRFFIEFHFNSIPAKSISRLSTRLAAKSHDPQYQGDHPDQKAKVDEPVHHPQVKVLLWGCNNGKLKCICWLDFLHMCFGFHSSISQ